MRGEFQMIDTRIASVECSSSEKAALASQPASTSLDKHLCFDDDVLSGAQLTQALDAFVDGSIVSDDDKSMDECDIEATPLDFRIDWSKETMANLMDSFRENSVLSIVTNSLDDGSESDFDVTEAEAESICSCDEVSEIDDCKQLSDLWDENQEVNLPEIIRVANEVSRSERVDTTWIQPEYPEVWRSHP